ncbi:hypothetical protein CTAYLR_007361 [Chrysophaeum taylorii]|uniref:G-protein coupled receptors family 2 profile 2 domain-containing protein n=1 Tax=Chrysophaeum taylorii TaxID=2483200 RepID=A0AAD7U4J3_9STRA|nr:hypothetical protein CTAYLR_007361 [Chrysophaeum taylorii]
MEDVTWGGERRLLEYDFSDRKLGVLLAIAVTESVVSFLGGLFIVTSFLKFDSLRSKFAFEQVANMALADMGSCVTYFFGSPRDRSVLCNVQAVLQQAFELTSVLWATAIASTLSLAIRRRESLDPRKLRTRIYVYAWGAPFVVSLLPLSTSSYGSAGAWCWIRNKPRASSHAWRFTIFYAPIWLAIIYNGVVYAQSAALLRRLSTIAGDDAAAKLKVAIARLVKYPLILVVCWFFPTVNRIQQIVQPRRPIFSLYVLTVLSRSALGALNALAFGNTEVVKNEWLRALERAGIVDTLEDDALVWSFPDDGKHDIADRNPVVELGKDACSIELSARPQQQPASVPRHLETEDERRMTAGSIDEDDDGLDQVEL